MKKNYAIAYLYLIILICLNVFYNYVSITYKTFNKISLIPVIFTISLALFLFFKYKKMYSPKRYSYIVRNNTIIFVILYYIFIYILGLFTGFMKNPLSLSLLNIIVNFIQIILAKFIFESIRFNLIKINKSNIFCILATLAFALFYVNFATILSFTSYGAIFKYICRYVIPIIALGSISTYIAKNGSFVSLLIIQLVPSFVSTYIKYQPDLNFFLSGLIAIIFAMTFYLITKYQIDLKNTDLKRSNIKRNNPLTYIPYFIVFGIIVCFVIGLFSYVPVAVMSNSMYPVYQRGDVIIYKKINNPSNLKVGDIVCYKLNNILVMHRIAKIEKTNGKLLFTTKGDNLDHNDVKKVTERQIVGIIKKIVPKCGYPSVWFYEFLSK